ncbi:extracellular solute-binding protein [Catenulispora pinisilvae]|uniref:extracellular solute-binding protein n=1 Tax=Catenulispora pinisilvae TaxID=2705253 RepID=UPI0018911BDF|nr:extracellular solute-binding protein [Catenulispora pinisilvae]
MSTDYSRRAILRASAAAAVAAAAVPSLAACGAGKSGTTSASNAGKQLAPWPTYTPVKGLNPDFPGTAAGVQDTFLHYPQNLVQSVPAKPGDGSTVKVMMVTYGAPPKGPDANQLWKAVNDAAGVDIELTMVADADFVVKYSTMMAAGDLPDIMMLGLYPLPNQAQFIQAKCADLTEYLSGDAGAKNYPNLAAIPGFTWDAMGRVGGRIYAVPTNRPRLGNSFYANSDKFTQASIWRPTVGGLKKDDLTKGLQTLNAKGHFALGTSTAANFGYLSHAGVHGAPNLWQLSGGAFTTTYGTDEFKASVATMADWFGKGLYDPGALTTSTVQCKSYFQNGTYLSDTDGFGAFTSFATTMGSTSTVDFVRPYDAGTAPTPWFASGYFGYTALKQAPPARIKMLLNVLNFFAAPFGSKEYELINYGIEGVHFTRGKDGGPSVPTDLGKVENNVNLPFKYIAAPPLVNYIPGQPEAAKRCYQAQMDIVPKGVADPSLGIQSPTFNKKWPTLLQLIDDSVNDIVTGKQPVSSWDGVVKSWKSQGGDAIAAELAAEYGKLHS